MSMYSGGVAATVADLNLVTPSDGRLLRRAASGPADVVMTGATRQVRVLAEQVRGGGSAPPSADGLVGDTRASVAESGGASMGGQDRRVGRSDRVRRSSEAMEDVENADEDVENMVMATAAMTSNSPTVRSGPLSALGGRVARRMHSGPALPPSPPGRANASWTPSDVSNFTYYAHHAEMEASPRSSLGGSRPDDLHLFLPAGDETELRSADHRRTFRPSNRRAAAEPLLG